MNMKKVLLISMLAIPFAMTSVSTMADQKKFKKFKKINPGSIFAQKACAVGKLSGGKCIHYPKPGEDCPKGYEEGTDAGTGKRFCRGDPTDIPDAPGGTHSTKGRTILVD